MINPEQELFDLLTSSPKKPTAPSEDSSIEKELKKDDPDFGTPVTIRNLFTHHDTHPVVIDFALMKVFGIYWLGWERETIYSEINTEFQSQISEHAKAKIQTVKTMHVSAAPWKQWQVFEKIVQGLNNNIPNWEVMQAPSIEQLFAAIDSFDFIRKEDFSEEVKQYMAASILHEDVTFTPEPLDFLQLYVAQPKTVCNDCGLETSSLYSDGICDACSGRFDPSQGLSLQPNQVKIMDGKGKNTKVVFTYDYASVRDKWDHVKNIKSDQVELEDNAVDSQIAKLLISRDYMNIRRRQLAEQLVSLKSWLGST